MKNNLRMLSLALCMLPMYLHAGTEQDTKPAYQPAQEQNARSVEPIPAGTMIPVSLNSTLRSDKSASGAAITATVMQNVPLGAGKTLRAGSKVTGHVVEAITPGKGSDESRISFQFDQVRFGNRTVPITANLKALASVTEVDDAQVPKSGGIEDYSGSSSLVQIGGDQVSYGQGGPVMLGSKVVGEYTSRGVLSGDTRPQALWLFSANASGAYGFGDLQIIHSERTEPAGEVTLTSNRNVLKVGKGSAMLLRVDGSGPEPAQVRPSLSRETGQ
jgi:hypothetical protein